ncbi:MAG: hypothetical protein HFF18_01485 [Oscillospiraceae bacterium]|nr:hypothetical protein [Oscillospiraceae bacterium]
MKSIRRIVSLLLPVCMLLAIAACSNSGNNSQPTPSPTSSPGGQPVQAAPLSTEPQYGGSATFYSEELKAIFDPSMDDSYSYALWFEGLWSIDWAGQDFGFKSKYITYDHLAGQIADTWEFDEEAAVLTVNLRQDVYFQDKAPYNGRQLTAKDVEWSFCRLLGLNGYPKVETTGNANWAVSLSNLAGVTVLDDYTIQFQLNTPTEVALNTFMTVGASVNIGGPEWDELTPEQQSSVDYAAGTGPYILKELSVDNYAIFEKNPNYYDYDERYPENRLPYLDTIKLVYIADSANILTQFIAGELDYIGWRSNLLSASQRSQLESALDSSAYTRYPYDTGPMSIGVKMNTEPFNDVRVRRAMQMAIDLNTTTVYTTGEPSPKVVVPGLWSTAMVDCTSVGSGTWGEEITSQFSYDVEGAKELLAAAGYPNGFEFTIVLPPVADTDLYMLAKNYLAAVGITMNIETVSTVPELMPIQANPEDSRAYFSGIVGTDSISGAVTNLFVPNGVSYGFFYEDTEEGKQFIDLLYNMVEATELDKFNEYARAADQLFAEQRWAIALAGNSYVYDYMSSHIGGYTGEKVKANLNMRTIYARLWSTTGT